MAKHTVKKSLGDRGQYIIAQLEGAFLLVKIHDGNNTIAFSEWLDYANDRARTISFLNKLLDVIGTARSHVIDYVPPEPEE